MLHVDGLDGRVAVVTGAGRGIGRRIGELLASQGARVAGLDLTAPEGPGMLGIACDVSDPQSVDDAFSAVEHELGSVEILVLNAGIYIIEPFAETTLDTWKRSLDVNLIGAFLCAQRALPAMRQAGYGRIVAIGSSAGKTGGATSCAAYAASKAGVMALAKSIASEYARYGITSNALAPALIDTPMIAETRDMVSRIPVGRLGTPNDVAAVVAFLCSSHAGYITGEVVDVNGGFLID
jgi:NAD(P)-dependent dehydrogenase (short-subunit alcohol dehydrogenase family)